MPNTQEAFMDAPMRSFKKKILLLLRGLGPARDQNQIFKALRARLGGAPGSTRSLRLEGVVTVTRLRDSRLFLRPAEYEHHPEVLPDIHILEPAPLAESRSPRVTPPGTQFS